MESLNSMATTFNNLFDKMLECEKEKFITIVINDFTLILAAN